MNCPVCGVPIAPDVSFCTSCGAACPPAPAAPVVVESSRTNGFAIAALVFGLLGGSVLALVFGYVGRSQIKKSGGREQGSGLAIAGIVLGWLGMAATAAVVIALVVAANSVSDSNSYDYGATSGTDGFTSSNDYAPSTTFSSPPSTVASATTTTAPRAMGSYRITDSGVIIRTGAGTTFPEIGRIPPEMIVPVYCRRSGEPIVGPYNGPPGDPWWDKVTYNGVTGFVTDEYVDDQADIARGLVPPTCP